MSLKIQNLIPAPNRPGQTNNFQQNFFGGTANLGTAFKITSSGTFTLLHSFIGFPEEGAHPYAGLIQGADGDLYGTTYNGGASARGTIFKMTSAGVVTILYSFSGGADGAHPYAALVWDRVFYLDTWDPALVTQFYGMREFAIEDSDGYIITFAERVQG